MVRHAIFVLVLVGAAFAGGAAINGPGLAWVHRNFIGGPTIIVDGSTPGGGEAGRPARRSASANPPPLQVDFSTKPSGLPRPSIQAPVPPPPPASSPTPANSAPGDLPPLDLPPESAFAPNPNVATSSAPAKADPIARQVSAVAPEPAPVAPSTSPSRDWAEARQRLKALGVSRYTVEAETGGRVRFSCVIPVDGLRAVGHHFEAEGDDEFQAIDATVRRVTLWKATESSPANP